MKLPGHAWLEFEVTGDSTGSVIKQTATVDPKGLLGPAYWYSVFPLHKLVFGGMLESIAAKGRTASSVHAHILQKHSTAFVSMKKTLFGF